MLIPAIALAQDLMGKALLTRIHLCIFSVVKLQNWCGKDIQFD
jgi:hypothetical protein